MSKIGKRPLRLKGPTAIAIHSFIHIASSGLARMCLTGCWPRQHVDARARQFAQPSETQPNVVFNGESRDELKMSVYYLVHFAACKQRASPGSYKDYGDEFNLPLAFAEHVARFVLLSLVQIVHSNGADARCCPCRRYRRPYVKLIV